MSLEQIDRYEIKEELGRGGMATVYRAFDPHFQREVALKVLTHRYLHDLTFRARFEREAQTIASLEHPAIVPVYDFGEEDEQPFLVMRLMRGGSLVDRIAVGPLPLRQTAEILNRLAPALDYAHDHAVIHRDLKPQNILFDRWNKPYLADFGIAKLVEEDVTNLTAGGTVGTPAYMSPEQVSGVDELDGRSDVYALGVILFEMLAGKSPYEARTPMSLALKHITESVPVILESNQSLPVETQAVIDRALAKDSTERYQTAAALAAAVSDLAAGAPEAPPILPVLPIATTAQPAAELGDEPEETPSTEDAEAATILATAALIATASPDISSTVVDEPSVEHLAEQDDDEKIGWLPLFLSSNWHYLALILLLLLIGVASFYWLSTRTRPLSASTTPTPLATQLPVTEERELVIPAVDPATATPSHTPAASATILPNPSRTPTQTQEPTRTPQETSQPSPSAAPSSSPTRANIPTETATLVSLLIVSQPSGELKNPFNFSWSGSSSTRYRVILRHLSGDYSHASDWLSSTSWTFDIPGEQFGAWTWHVESEDGTQSESDEFFFNPHTGSGGSSSTAATYTPERPDR